MGSRLAGAKAKSASLTVNPSSARRPSTTGRRSPWGWVAAGSGRPWTIWSSRSTRFSCREPREAAAAVLQPLNQPCLLGWAALSPPKSSFLINPQAGQEGRKSRKNRKSRKSRQSRAASPGRIPLRQLRSRLLFAWHVIKYNTVPLDHWYSTSILLVFDSLSAADVTLLSKHRPLQSKSAADVHISASESTS